MRMKNHLKTKEMSRKRSQRNTILTERGLNKNVKIKGCKKNGAKRKPCQENGM